MNSQVTGQQKPGKNKKYLRPSFIVLIVSVVVYFAASGYASYRDNQAYKAALPQPWLNTWVNDLRAYYMKVRPARFPNDLAELDAVLWKTTRPEGRPGPSFGDGNRTYVYENYKYTYYPVPGRPDLCAVLAYPLGPRRGEPGVKAFFLVVSPTALSKWEGRALSDEDIEQIRPAAIPTVGQLQRWGLINPDYNSGAAASASPSPTASAKPSPATVKR